MLTVWTTLNLNLKISSTNRVLKTKTNQTNNKKINTTTEQTVYLENKAALISHVVPPIESWKVFWKQMQVKTRYLMLKVCLPNVPLFSLCAHSQYKGREQVRKDDSSYWTFSNSCCRIGFNFFLVLYWRVVSENYYLLWAFQIWLP